MALEFTWLAVLTPTFLRRLRTGGGDDLFSEKVVGCADVSKRSYERLC